MPQHPKLQTYTAMAAQHTAAITGSYDTWTAFLRTASRLHKYSFLEQLMIHVQRPDATACAGYDLWRDKMHRHVRYRAKGIAIISQVNDVPTLRYVFDISDTLPDTDARIPYIWQYREEHQAVLSKAIEDCFYIPADQGVSFQLASMAAQFAGQYWEMYREQVLQAVKNTLLQKYGEADASMAFQDATAASVSFAALSRCNLSPEDIFDPEDFTHVYECNDYESVMALGIAVSMLNDTLLRFVGGTIRQYECEKRAGQQQEQAVTVNTPSVETQPPVVTPPPADNPGGHESQETPQHDTTPQEGPDEASSGPSPISAPEQQEIALPMPSAPRSKAETQAKPIPADNFRITNDNLGEGGPKAKYAMNIEAIRVLKNLESEHRAASPEEQETLSRYVGWGGVADAFDESKPEWATEYTELKSMLTDAEYASARSSVLNAHYTTPAVIKAIYAALGNMGFQSGNILEPSCGVGNFFGLLPEAMSASRLYGVELDSLSGRIARQLYPKAHITVAGFETTDRKDFYDIAVGNVPFGQYQVNDPAYNKHNFSIHNYFLCKTIDQLRPGGVMAVVTSRYTMDAKDSAARKYLAERADLLGAIRLPNTAFKANAGTDIVSDILFLQKLDEPNPALPDWVSVMENPDGYPVNSYFNDHPEMILGCPGIESTRYGYDYTVYPTPGADLSQQLQEAIQRIHGTYRKAAATELDEEQVDSILADPDVKNFSFTLVDGEVYYRENSVMIRPKLNATAKARVTGMVKLRDCVHSLIALQMDEHTPDSAIKAKQDELSRLYDAFNRKFGLINGRANRLAFDRDSSYYLLCSLEVLDKDGKLERKADIFTKRTIKQRTPVTHVDTAQEALAVSIGERARVDLPYMARLTGKPEAELISDLQGLIFKDPASGDEPFTGWQTTDEYLSGNVRRKLRVAERAAEQDPAYQVNVDALAAAQPKDLDASEIEVRLGATWIAPEYVQQFMYETFQTPMYRRDDIRIVFVKATAAWSITNKSWVADNDVTARTTYGTDRRSAYEILEESLNLRDVRVYDYIEDADGKEKRVLNVKATTLAAQKQQSIKDAFKSWIFRDPERRQALVQHYNDTMNCIRPREYDGSHIIFHGINPAITLKPHQLGAIAHVLYGGNTLLAHEVGAGKTFEMIASAMECKHLGLCTKPIFVVPNHLTQQTAAEFLRLYPAASILVTTKRDFETARRKKFCGRIATGSWDAVIIGHSQFEKIPMSYERQKKIIDDQIEDIADAIEEIKADKGERFTIKQMALLMKSLQARLDKLKADWKKDSVISFEQLGVDMMFVDESDNYKNLFLYTKMRNVAGLSTADAQKSSDMFAKCRYLDEITHGRGIVFATGTPISNSMTEFYTIQRYLQYDRLQEMGMGVFDSWASRFGETVTALELAPEGTGYRARTRFAKFFNLPELMAMFKEVADIKTADQLNLPVPEVEYHTVVCKPTEHQKALVKELSKRAEKVHSGTVDAHIDNMLRITSDGRKLGLDQRIINPALPDGPGTKVNQCVANILKHWHEGEADRLTQLVFCDISTPTAGKGGFNVYDDLKSKLIKAGMPPEQIAFIHDADSDAQKKELFAKVCSGQVRVLIGSTQKMGAGTNVQDRLIASHDLDCPWRPRDLTQRAGRIIRQGNMNQKVHIYRYVTESTFDSYLWQTVEAKQKFIAQVMTSRTPLRSCEDVDETALSFAEIKALCAGDPRIKERMELDVDVAKLRIMQADYQAKKYRLEDDVLTRFPAEISRSEATIIAIQKDMQTLAEHPHPEDGFIGMKIHGRNYLEKDKAGEAFLDAVSAVSQTDPVEVASYRGLTVSAALTLFGDHKIVFKGATAYSVELGDSASGNLTRIDNALARLPEHLESAKTKLDGLKQQLEAAKAELGRPFAQEAELKAKSARLAELDALLNLGGKAADGQAA